MPDETADDSYEKAVWHKGEADETLLRQIDRRPHHKFDAARLRFLIEKHVEGHWADSRARFVPGVPRTSGKRCARRRSTPRPRPVETIAKAKTGKDAVVPAKSDRVEPASPTCTPPAGARDGATRPDDSGLRTQWERVTGFMEHRAVARERYAPACRDAILKHYKEFTLPIRPEGGRLPRQQAARCMDCGIAVSVNSGCPVNNQSFRTSTTWSIRIEWEARVDGACTRPTTSRSSPAASARRRAKPRACSTSTTTSVTHQVHRARSIADRAWEEGWIAPQKSLRQATRAGRSRSIGSGPAGHRLPRSNSRAPAMTSIGVREERQTSADCCATASPTSRWRSTHIDRRVAQMEAEGVVVPHRRGRRRLAQGRRRSPITQGSERGAAEVRVRRGAARLRARRSLA